MIRLTKSIDIRIGHTIEKGSILAAAKETTIIKSVMKFDPLYIINKYPDISDKHLAKIKRVFNSMQVQKKKMIDPYIITAVFEGLKVPLRANDFEVVR